MKKIHEVLEKKHGGYKEKVLQFGEGNFLRAFTDWMIDGANDAGAYAGSVVLVQPIAQGLGTMLNAQDNLYTLVMQGLENGEKTQRKAVISSVSRTLNPYEDFEAYFSLARSEDLEVVISNTTEAGISYSPGNTLADRPQSAFPAKVCAFLYERYTHFNGDRAKGLLFLPVELIDNNGRELKRIVLEYAREWDLPMDFQVWVEEANTFASTLVDRIVTGYPRGEIDAYQEMLGYEDNLLVTSELFNLWVIESDKDYSAKFPVHASGANVIWTKDVTPYKKRKVRILNGAHTASVLAAYLADHDTVLEMMEDPAFAGYLSNLVHGEVIPGIDLPEEELKAFAEAVFQRFKNPYIKHRLLDISLNSVSKFTARCLPSLKDAAARTGEAPAHLSFALAALLAFYRIEEEDGAFFGKRGTETYPVRDDLPVLEFMAKTWKDTADAKTLTQAVLENAALWGEDLTEIPGLFAAVAAHLDTLLSQGVHAALLKI